MKKRVTIGLVIVAFFAIALAFKTDLFSREVISVRNQDVQTEGGSISIGNTNIFVERADTNEKRVLGLSGREGLKEGHGMLFVFDTPDVAHFWMKDMKFAIDIIWIDQFKKIIHIEKAVSPQSYPKTFSAGTPVLYVLEVPAGFSETHQIHVGDQVEM